MICFTVILPLLTDWDSFGGGCPVRSVVRRHHLTPTILMFISFSSNRCESEESNLWSLWQHLPHPEELQETMMALVVVVQVCVSVASCESYNVQSANVLALWIFFEDWEVLMWLGDVYTLEVCEDLYAPFQWAAEDTEVKLMPLLTPLPLLYLNPLSQTGLSPDAVGSSLGWCVQVRDKLWVFSSGCLGLKNLVSLVAGLAERSSINFPLLLCKKAMWVFYNYVSYVWYTWKWCERMCMTILWWEHS